MQQNATCVPRRTDSCWLVWDASTSLLGVTHSGRLTEVWAGLQSLHREILKMLPQHKGIYALYFSLFKYLSYCLLLCGLQLIAAVKRLIAT